MLKTVEGRDNNDDINGCLNHNGRTLCTIFSQKVNFSAHRLIVLATGSGRRGTEESVPLRLVQPQYVLIVEILQ